MFKISPKNTFLFKEVDQPHWGDKILHMRLQQEACSTRCLGLPEEEQNGWKSSKKSEKKGHLEVYSDAAIECLLVIKQVYNQDFRDLKFILCWLPTNWTG